MTIAERKFGIEVEFKGNRSLAKRFLNQHNVKFSGANSWRLKYDQSVHAPHNMSSELVSPPMKGETGINEVRRVLQLLVRWGRGEVNKHCGLHVHVDAADLNAQQCLHVLKRYKKFERDIDKFMPRSRRGDKNEYCQSLNGIDGFEWECLSEANTKITLGGDYFDRYRKLNLASLMDHGTIEFRQHSGTMNYNKIENWIRFCVGFVEASKSACEAQRASNEQGPTQQVSDALRGNLKRMADVLAGYTRHASVSQLHRRIGCAPSSIPNLISKLRRKGYVVENRNGKYKLISSPQLPRQQDIDLVKYVESIRGLFCIASGHVKLVRAFAAPSSPRYTSPRYTSLPNLVEVTGLSASTVRGYISHLRFIGFVISICHGFVEFDHAATKANILHGHEYRGLREYIRVSSTQQEPQQQAQEDPNDKWSKGIDPEVVMFYRERAMELA